MHYFSGKGCSEFLESMHYCIGILISPDCRGKGVGKQLYQRFLQYLKNEHLNSFYLYTDTSCNYGFYEHQGMVRRCEKEHFFTVNQQRSKMTFFIYDYEI